MITLWNNFGNNFEQPTGMQHLRRMMDRFFDEADRDFVWGAERHQWPRTTLFNQGDTWVLTAEVPGLTEQDISLSVHQDVLTLSGERKSPELQGYTTHRKERPTLKFSKSFSLPTKVDLEKVTAMVKDGILTVTLPKSPEVKARQIQIKSSQ